jgi:hypothetical protein
MTAFSYGSDYRSMGLCWLFGGKERDFVGKLYCKIELIVFQIVITFVKSW